ncbi:MAG TPA: glucosyl-3-phosphoglycerate synthase [Acidimicrobiales bacterium]|jgi:glucosyl-3-phosphoglycerate synthase|nr:glucosyl-3-phosphoglycerate synthase [Acidimicrobiales bacterium]
MSFPYLSPSQLVERKGDLRVSVCLPAHNESPTIAGIVGRIRADLMDTVPLVDEVLVVDDASTDDTAEVAKATGARVVSAADVLPEEGTRRGKGEALWKSVAAADGDLIVWLDADLEQFDTSFVTGLVAPLLGDPDVALVKGYYERPGGEGEVGGGRVTELVARPVLTTWFPELVDIIQPIGGEYASRREVVERVRFAGGYGVDIGLLIDITGGWGVEAVAQIDLGVRKHRNRPLHELGPQALAVMTTALRRAGLDVTDTPVYRRPDGLVAPVDVRDRPPLVHVAGYRPASEIGPAPASTTASRGAAGASDGRLAEFVDGLAGPGARAAMPPIGEGDDPLEGVARAIARRRDGLSEGPPRGDD